MINWVILSDHTSAPTESSEANMYIGHMIHESSSSIPLHIHELFSTATQSHHQESIILHQSQGLPSLAPELSRSSNAGMLLVKINQPSKETPGRRIQMTADTGQKNGAILLRSRRKEKSSRSSIAFLQEESGKAKKTDQAGARSGHLGGGTLERSWA